MGGETKHNIHHKYHFYVVLKIASKCSGSFVNHVNMFRQSANAQQAIANIDVGRGGQGEHLPPLNFPQKNLDYVLMVKHWSYAQWVN